MTFPPAPSLSPSLTHKHTYMGSSPLSILLCLGTRALAVILLHCSPVSGANPTPPPPPTPLLPSPVKSPPYQAPNPSSPTNSSLKDPGNAPAPPPPHSTHSSNRRPRPLHKAPFPPRKTHSSRSHRPSSFHERGKTAGIALIGFAGLLQVAVGTFLLLKRMQMLKTAKNFEEPSQH